MLKKILLAVAIALPMFGASAQSRIETFTLESRVLGAPKTCSVYLPDGYDASQKSYPVLYLLHGASDDHTAWVERGQVRRIADAADASDLEYEKATEAMYDAKVNQAQIERTYMDKFKNVLNKKQLFELKSVEKQFQRDMLKQHQRLRSRRAAENAQ